MTCSSPARYKKLIRSFSLNVEGVGLIPFPVQNFQDDIIDVVMAREWDDEEGRWARKHRETVLGLGRKNAKTELTAAIALANMILDAPKHGLIVLAASKRDQAALLLAAAKRLVWNSTIGGQPLSKFIKVRKDHIYFPEKDCYLRTIAAEAQKEHGLNPHLVIVDEGHATLEKDRELYDTLLTAQGVRQDPIAVIITTAGPAPTGPMYELYKYGKEVQSGKRPADPAFGFLWYEAEEGAEIDDLNAWRAANPAFDVFPNFRRNAERTIAQVKAGRMPEFMARRLHLNQWTTAAERWLPFDKVLACGGDPMFPPGCAVTIGIDASTNKDAFAVAIVHDIDGYAHVKTKIFTPPQEGEYVDPDEVVYWLTGFAQDHDVTKVVYDPAYMQLIAQRLIERGLPCEKFPQSPERMVPATATFWRKFTQEEVRHGGDERLLEHITAITTKPSERGPRMSKLAARMPTDLAFALAMALDDLYGGVEEESHFLFFA